MDDNLQQELSLNVLQSMAVGKVFKHNKKHITCIDFDDTGEYLVTASEDESIGLYDCRFGKEKKILYSKKYGIKLCKFAHTSNSIIHSSTKEDDTIRYLSLHDNRYLRYFKGHKNKVVSLDMSPVNDTFISAAVDDSVRLWDLRSNNCSGLVHVKGYPSVAIDHRGLVFAVGLENNSVRLYDIRNFEKGPFGMTPVANTPNMFGKDEKWSGIKFSNNGCDMLITTRQEKIYVLDSFTYTLKHTLSGFQNKTQLNIEASFSPDGKYIFGGSQDGIVHAWEVASGKKVKEFTGHPAAVSCVAFNPRYLMMASACVNLAFWIPSMDWAAGNRLF